MLAADNGYVTVGHSASTNQDLAGLNKGSDDAIIVKYDVDGEVQWNKNFGGSGGDQFHSVASTPDGGYIAVGESNSTDHDLTGLYKGGSGEDAIIVKYDTDGNKEWNKSFGGSRTDRFQSVATSPNGGYVVVGYSFSDDQDMTGLHYGGAAFADAIIVNYDVDGNIVWSKHFGGSADSRFRSVAITSDGGYIAAGQSNATNQDLAGLNKGGTDAIIVKYDAEGNVEWNKNFGGSRTDEFRSVISTSDDGYVAVGYSDSNDGDLAGLNKGGYDATIVRFDGDGEVGWSRNFGGANSDLFLSVAITLDGGYIAAGYSDSTNQDLAGLNKGGTDAIIVKYDADGDVEWNKNFGGNDYDYFHSVAVTLDDGHIVVGNSTSTDQDLVGLYKGGSGYDAIVVKYLDMSEPVGIVFSDAGDEGCEAVTITITTNVPIEIPDGWTRTGFTEYKKVYTENTEEEVAIVGLNGVTGDSVQVIVDTIICLPGEEPEPPDPLEPFVEPTSPGTGEGLGAVTWGFGPPRRVRVEL